MTVRRPRPRLRLRFQLGLQDPKLLRRPRPVLLHRQRRQPAPAVRRQVRPAGAAVCPRQAHHGRQRRESRADHERGDPQPHADRAALAAGQLRGHVGTVWWAGVDGTDVLLLGDVQGEQPVVFAVPVGGRREMLAWVGQGPLKEPRFLYIVFSCSSATKSPNELYMFTHPVLLPLAWVPSPTPCSQRMPFAREASPSPPAPAPNHRPRPSCSSTPLSPGCRPSFREVRASA